MQNNYSLLKLNSSLYFENDLLFSVEHYIVEIEPQLHWHEFYEFEYIISGSATHTINDKSFRIGPGSMQLITPVDFHSYKYEEGDEKLDLINIKFQDLFLPAKLRNDICRQTHPIQAISSPKAMKTCVESLLSEYEHNNYGRDMIIESGIIELCVNILREMESPKEATDADNSYSSIQEAVLYVRTHFRSPLTAEAVAKTVHLSPNYFSEYFKKQTGEKFSLYVLNLRINFAMNLLKISDMSIKEIAYESGFNSAAYFSNTFKDFFGMSPDKYRKMYGQSKS